MSINETTLEIDRQALEHNYRFLRQKTAKGTQFMAVVKAFGYGSEQGEIAKKLEDCGVDHFAVAYIEEGVDLRQSGISKPILVLHAQATNFDQMIEHHLMPCLYNTAILTSFAGFLEHNRIDSHPVHIEINTGMNRLGFACDDIESLKTTLDKQPALDIHGLYTHFVASEDLSERAFTEQQIARFEAAAETLKPVLNDRTLLHCCNTSGILNYPEAHFDLVRSGIGLYGYGNASQIDNQLQPVASLKTLISQINSLKPGDTSGYNRDFKAEKPTKTATLPLGHADGIARIFGHGKSCVEVKGKSCPIIGNVCMDMIMIDITGVDCALGDEVLIFGKNKSAEEFAHSAGTNSYELITSIGRRVKRKVIN